jgi:hypothetical protein
MTKMKRALLAYTDDGDAFAYSEDLAAAIYQPKKGWPAVTRAQQVSVLRAMHSLARKFPDRFVLNGGKGREPLRIVRLPSRRRSRSRAASR